MGFIQPPLSNVGVLNPLSGLDLMENSLPNKLKKGTKKYYI
jgi:hypothetical protein